MNSLVQSPQPGCEPKIDRCQICGHVLWSRHGFPYCGHVGMQWLVSIINNVDGIHWPKNWYINASCCCDGNLLNECWLQHARLYLIVSKFLQTMSPECTLRVMMCKWWRWVWHRQACAWIRLCSGLAWLHLTVTKIEEKNLSASVSLTVRLDVT